TFKFKDSASKQNRSCTLAAPEFIRRFLQHVLPPGFVKVRYYGLLSPTNRRRLAQAKELLTTNTSAPAPAPPPAPHAAPPTRPRPPSTPFLFPQSGHALI